MREERRCPDAAQAKQKQQADVRSFSQTSGLQLSLQVQSHMNTVMFSEGQELARATVPVQRERGSSQHEHKLCKLNTHRA